MKKPLISICIPNYNYEKFIGETIESVLAQTYENFELIIVDNGSTDNSVEIINSYNDERIKLYQNETNIPLYQNINKAQLLANGEFIAVLHSDDKYEPDFLEEIIAAYQRYPEQKVFVTGVYLLHHQENKIITQHAFQKEGLKHRLKVLLRLTMGNNIGNGVNVVYHRECIKKAGMFSDEYKYAADYDLWFRLGELYDFVYIRKNLAYYRIHDSNLSHTVNKNFAMMEEGDKIFRKSVYKSKLLTSDLYPSIFFLNPGYSVYKSYCMGKNYKSGKFLRDRLNYFRKNYKTLNFNLLWYYTYLISFVVNEKIPKTIKTPVLIVNRVIFYLYQTYIFQRLFNFIADLSESQIMKNISGTRNKESLPIH